MLLFYGLLLFCLVSETWSDGGYGDGGWFVNTHNPGNYLQPGDDRHTVGKMLAEVAVDIVRNQEHKSKLLENPRYDNKLCPAFEVGYMTQTIHEHYRKMISKWQSVRMTHITRLYNMECVLYLEEIEHLYWQIKHEVHMLHEVERKYQVQSTIDETYEDPFYFDPFSTLPPPVNPDERQIKEVKSFNVKEMFKGNIIDGKIIVTTRKPGPRPFPMSYGFEMYEWNSDT